MKGIKLSQLILFKRVGWLFAGLLIIIVFGWKSWDETVSASLPSILTASPWTLLFLFLSYLLQAEATRSLFKKSPPSLLFLLKLKIVCDTYNKISYLAPFRGDTMFRQILEKKKKISEGTEILILDRAIAGISSFWTTTMLLLFGVVLSLPLPSLASIGIGILAGLGLLKWMPFERLRFYFSSQAQKGHSEEADRSLARFVEGNRARYWSSLIFHILSQLILCLVIYWLGKSFFESFSLSQAFLLTGIFPLLSRLLRFLPASLGFFEIACATLMALFYGSEGLALGFLLAIMFRLVVLAGVTAGLLIGGNPTKVLFR
ncbi:MAG: hypothetical protein HYT76_07110 [Deltaproteobacteria bacterium]|nr:hypothetical protein [Deltaproteobacteria bacterium]